MAGTYLQRVLRTFRSLSQLLLPAAVTVLVVYGEIVQPRLAVTLRNAAFDAYQRSRPRLQPPGSARVVVVDIDDASLARLGQWPWPRTTLAALLDRLTELGARTIALDIVFAEPDRTSPSAMLQTWKAHGALAATLVKMPDHDQIFARTVAKSPVVTGFVLSEHKQGVAPALKAGFVTAGDNPAGFLPSYSGAVTTLPAIEAAAVGNGALNFPPSGDGVVRRLPLVFRSGEHLYPSLAGEAVRVATGARSYVIKASGASGENRFGERTGIVGVRIGDSAIPTDGEGRVWIHYARVRSDRWLPAWKVLAGEVAGDALEGKIVLVGTSAAGLKDLRFSPLEGVLPGVEMHAQVIEQILEKSFLVRPDWATAAEVLFTLAISLVLIVLVFRLGALWSAIAGGIAVCGAALLSWWAFLYAGLLMDPLVPALGAAAVYLACSIPRHLQTESERRWIRGAFSSYISPNLVEYLMEHRDQLRLGGERRECTFVMTDLAGFTSLVEQSDPETVVGLLNEYLDGMVEIALAHEGTLDRIVGDAVAVMFSAPVEQRDHAERALRCALEFDRFSCRFRQRKAAEGLALGVTRIGVHTGTVTIGNVGGKRLIDYRALGDPVNTAARLETVNKQLGIRMCTSESTVSRCTGFIGRPVGRLVLKGKREALEVFEPLDASSAATPVVAAYRAAFSLMEAGDARAVQAFSAIADHDPLAAFHLARLRRGEVGSTVVLSEK